MAGEEKKGIVAEFKEFIARGNVMDLAVGIIIGGAFTAIVTSLVDNIINPLITLAAGGGTDSLGALAIQVTPDVTLNFGNFIGAIINFLIIALVVFALIKAINGATATAKKLAGKADEEAAEEEPPTCPFCLEEVKEGAMRCPHCAGEFSEPAAPKPAEA
ncbi:MAG TPA: large conductance mechanosensitive channel protein MscL [Eggerthellaceae bacterium]|nr:large conductance mechanosensitive channel protein MscL [Eggerthellaceae bacterium]